MECIPQSRTYFSRAVSALCLLSLPLQCAIRGGGWVMVLQCDLKLSTRASQEVQDKISQHLYSAWGHLT